MSCYYIHSIVASGLSDFIVSHSIGETDQCRQEFPQRESFTPSITLCDDKFAESVSDNLQAFEEGNLLSLVGPDFREMRYSLGRFFVDRTALIERIITHGMGQRVDLVLRPRRCGKSCMLHMLKYE